MKYKATFSIIKLIIIEGWGGVLVRSLLNQMTARGAERGGEGCLYDLYRIKWLGVGCGWKGIYDDNLRFVLYLTYVYG